MFLSGHSAIDASDTSARTAPGVYVGQPAPKAASKVSHEARRSSEECWGRTHRTAPITNRHNSPWFESFRISLITLDYVFEKRHSAWLVRKVGQDLRVVRCVLLTHSAAAGQSGKHDHGVVDFPQGPVVAVRADDG